MTDPRVQILDKTVCYDGFFRIERYRLRHELFRGGWSRELTREILSVGMPRPCCRTILFLTPWC